MRLEILSDIGNPPAAGSSSVYKNPKAARPGEKIGGGFFVVRRGHRTGRIRPSWLQYEHSTLASAAAEAERLARLNPGLQFDVLAVVSSFRETQDTCDIPTIEAVVTAEVRA